jgi:hypothetical protein
MLKTIAPKFEVGEAVRLKECPDVGTVHEVEARIDPKTRKFEGWSYRARWPSTPGDDRWYAEAELVDARGGRDA